MKTLLSFMGFVLVLCSTFSFAQPLSAQTTETTTASSEATAIANPKVVMKTSLGDMTIELFANEAPITVANFIAYVKSDFYKDVIFHRVIPGFVVQAGGFDTQYQRKQTQAPIANESTSRVKNLRGTLSMARLPNPDSATTQFFINLQDNRNLDWRPGQPGYAVFGKVISGIEVIDQMATLAQGNHSGVFVNAPNEPVVISSVTLLEEASKK